MIGHGNGRRRALLTTALTMLLCAPAAHAGGFEELARTLSGRADRWWAVNGALRVRGELLYNLDLDRGLTPSGEPFFPVPEADPTAQHLTDADMRLRADLGVFTPGGAMGVKVRVDVLDNLRLGSTPEGHPTATSTQSAADAAFRIKRAFGIALTPIGFLAAGRMGSHWGLGMLTHGGDCDDCDSGDAADRIAFMTPIGGHLWALAYDFSATGPGGTRPSGTRGVDFEPTDDVRTLTFAMLKVHTELARKRRLAAGRLVVEYGAYASYRWQENDVPAAYLPVAETAGAAPGREVMARGFWALALDAWVRISHPWFRLELEAAVLLSEIEQASLIPGALLRDPIEARQVGAAFQSEVGAPGGQVFGGVDAGFASGDPTPGFGASSGPTDAPTQPGDLDGPQAAPPHDNRVDNFRFHRDFRIDRILFRELIGTVTDAVYVRPHIRWDIAEIGPGILTASLAVVATFAVEASSTPGGARALGVELDPSLTWKSRDGFGLALDYAVLFPLDGLDNPTDGLGATPAQLLRMRVSYAF